MRGARASWGTVVAIHVAMDELLHETRRTVAFKAFAQLCARTERSEGRSGRAGKVPNSQARGPSPDRPRSRQSQISLKSPSPGPTFPAALRGRPQNGISPRCHAGPKFGSSARGDARSLRRSHGYVSRPMATIGSTRAVAAPLGRPPAGPGTRREPCRAPAGALRPACPPRPGARVGARNGASGGPETPAVQATALRHVTAAQP